MYGEVVISVDETQVPLDIEDPCLSYVEGFTFDDSTQTQG